LTGDAATEELVPPNLALGIEGMLEVVHDGFQGFGPVGEGNAVALNPIVHAGAKEVCHDVRCVLVLEVLAELVKGCFPRGTSLVALAAEDVVGILPETAAVEAAAILAVVEGLEASEGG
jgi:hypothetical protein